MKLIVLKGTLTVLVVFMTSLAFANVDELKAYRQVNSDLKPDCLYCHVDQKPKKDDGKHDLNVYGLKVEEMVKKENVEGMTKEQINEIYVKVFQQLGRHDQYKEDENNTGVKNEAASEKK